MKRAIIFLNGNRPSEKRVFETIKTTDTIICADGGVKHAVFFGLKPEVVIGDFDSTPKSLQKKLKQQKIPLLTYPADKDETDSELALSYAIEKGYKEIIIFAADGDRTDHMLANMLFFASLTNVSILVIKQKEKLFFVSQSLLLTGKKGDTVSLLPLQKDAIGIVTKGLQYALQNETLFFGKPRGVSNVMTGKKATIRVTKGMLLVIQQQ